jgi:hypothetical protein
MVRKRSRPRFVRIIPPRGYSQRKKKRFYTDEEGRKRPITERKKPLTPPILHKYYYNRLMFREKSSISQREYTKNDWEEGVSKAVGIEKAEEEMIYVINDDENRRGVVKTYKWSHDGPFDKFDYEPVIYFYEKNVSRPSHAISFSHYGYVYHKNLISWNRNDFSPRFPNEFHTPVLKAEKIKIIDGVLSRGAYACAVASLYTRHQKVVETSNVKNGIPPDSVRI